MGDVGFSHTHSSLELTWSVVKTSRAQEMTLLYSHHEQKSSSENRLMIEVDVL